MKVSIIGAGNVSWYFAYQLNSHALLLEVHHRSTVDNNWDRLSNIQFTTSQNINPKSDFVLIAVSDQAISEVLATYKIPTNCVLLHVSGSLPMEILSRYRKDNYGVLYPLQSLSMGRIPNSVPLMIEGNRQETENKVRLLAKNISSQITVLESQRRAEIHRAAIFASNFVNHLLTISSDLLENSSDFQWLQPLVLETVSKAFALGPSKSQTGPAIRGDQQIIASHLEALPDDQVKNIYRMLSEHILASHKK